MDDEKKNYEVGFISGSENTKTEVAKTIKDLEGEITIEGEPLKIRLAYPIKKQSSAVFCYLQFILKPENLIAFKKTIKLNPLILRFLIVKLTEGEKRAVVKDKERILRPRFSPVAPSAPKTVNALSNEELEKKIEEILK